MIAVLPPNILPSLPLPLSSERVEVPLEIPYNPGTSSLCKTRSIYPFPLSLDKEALSTNRQQIQGQSQLYLLEDPHENKAVYLLCM